MRGGLYFSPDVRIDLKTPELSTIFSNFDGVVHPSVGMTRPSSTIRGPFSWQPEYSIFGSGIDAASGFALGAYAPRGATVVSPITTVLHHVQDRTRVMDALQLSSGDFKLSSPVLVEQFSASANLNSEDAINRQVAQEIVASNIRLLTLTITGDIISRGANNYFSVDGVAPISRRFASEAEDLSLFLQEDRNARLYTSAGTQAFLNWLIAQKRVEYRAGVVEAMTHVANLYASAIGTTIGSKHEAAIWMLGLKAWLSPQLQQLRSQNSAAAAAQAMALTQTDVRNTVVRLEPLFPDMSGNLFPVPDFFRMRADSEKLLDAYPPNATDMDTPLWWNDYYFEEMGVVIEKRPLTAVNVPASQQAALSVTLQPDQSVQVRSLNGFKGVAWFDYTVSARANELRTGRVYMIVE